jgi:hypothetical protein
MSTDQVQNQYLVVGRNRRADLAADDAAHLETDELNEPDLGQAEDINNRPVMGRKGIGKLAGFGLATRMRVLTWKNQTSVEFTMDMEKLKLGDGVAADVPIKGFIGPIPPRVHTPSGTSITLSDLKHSTHLEIDKLRESLARRFSRRVRGRMNIYINEVLLGEPQLDYEIQYPPQDSPKSLIEEQLEDGTQVKYRYAFTRGTIQSAEMRGFTIYVRGKTAQAPPFYFHVEGTASGQHATKYLTGEIEADFLDEGTDDESDLIATDRQEIDWESKTVALLHQWGGQLTRRLFRDWTDRNGDRIESWIFSDADLLGRIEKLEPKTQKQVRDFLRKLGGVEPVRDRALELAGSLVRAYEYRHFIDVIGEIEFAAGESDPEILHNLLAHLSEWNVLESRAILEIIKGRLTIIEKFHSLIINDAPETASSQSLDNLHDLLAGSPWLLNPEWQVLTEEKGITKQLREWGHKDVDVADRQRFDFLALRGDGKLVVIEIKRSGHAVTLEELHRLEGYCSKLSQAETGTVYMVLIHSGLHNSITPTIKGNWDKRDDFDLVEWKDVFAQTKDYYEHYRAVLEGNVSHPDFQKKEVEIRQTRKVIDSGTVHRDPTARKQGLGPQDSDYTALAPLVVRDAEEKKSKG